ncbi:MAG: glycosyltransferase family 4 protein [Candidatus Methanofastidiosia archaeon]
MRISMIAPFGIKPRGTLRARMLPLANSLVRKGHETSIISPPFDFPEDSGKRYVIGRVEIINVKLSKIPFLKYLIISLRLVYESLKFKPEIVHIFKPKGFSGLAGMILIFLRYLGVLRIRIEVDCDDWEGFGGWNDLRNYPLLWKFFFDFQERWIPRNSDFVSVASLALLERMQSLGVLREKIIYLPNGLERNFFEEKFDPMKVRKKHKISGYAILLYTRFFEFELSDVVEIFALVKKKIPSAKLLVVGKGRFSEEERLKKMADEKGFAEDVFFAGWVEREKVKGYLKACDVAIYPYSDTLINRAKCSVKLIELLGLGIPVVASKVGQNCEYIQDEKTGFLIDAKKNDEFAKAVLRLLENKELRVRFGEESKKKIFDNYIWDFLSERVLRAYTDFGTK